jgi:recombinational DNA repair protein (RecF pathway)
MTLDEMAERRRRQAPALAATPALQGHHCAVCGQPPGAFHRDGESDRVLCRSCHLLIQDARERHATPGLAARWLRAAAQYLTPTERP